MAWSFRGPTHSCVIRAASCLIARPPLRICLMKFVEQWRADGDSLVTDLHVWQVGIGKYAAMISVVAHEPKSCESYRALLRGHHELVHVTIETQHCREDHAVGRKLVNGHRALAGRRGLCFRPCRWRDQHVAALGAQAALRAHQLRGRNAAGRHALCNFARRSERQRRMASSRGRS